MSVDFRSRRERFAGGPGSLLGAMRLWGLPSPVLPQESSRLPLQSTSFKINKVGKPLTRLPPYQTARALLRHTAYQHVTLNALFYPVHS